MRNLELRVGDILRDHRPTQPPVPYGRIVYIHAPDDQIIVAPYPKKDKAGHQKNYFPQPRTLSLAQVRADLQGDAPKRSVVEFSPPEHWLLTTAQIRENAGSLTSAASRRHLALWEDKARQAYERIGPFVEGRTIEDILLDPERPGWPAKRAAELGLKGVSQIQRDLHVYIFSLGLPASLRPFYSNCGLRGRPKHSRRKTGRPSPDALARGKGHEGLNCDDRARDAFIRGWAKFKKRGVSVAKAFHATLEEWFCQSDRWKDGQHSYTIEPAALRYTQQQFEYWGRKGLNALSALQIERGETAAKREYRRRMNKFATKTDTVNSEALLDSTSTDVTLVSAASRQIVLTAPWRTDVLDGGLGYIFGHHVSFDSPSGTTALLALRHAAGDKVAYCARFGIDIEPGQWHSMTFQRLRVDNGEAKSQLVMDLLNEIEGGAHYGQAYDAINKSPSESDHQTTHRELDHGLPGTTHGRPAVRGSPRAAETARLRYHEYMAELILRILRHNNDDQVPHLLTLEMRNDGVEPTRRAILEWKIAKGYVSSAPVDLKSLNTRCLPRLRGVIRADGVHIFDPWYRGDRVLDKLVYRSSWLERSGVLEKAHRQARPIDVHIDPMNLQEAWINLDGLRSLQMVTNDPDMRLLTLLDWCRVCADDRRNEFLARVGNTVRAIEEISRRNATVANANKELRAEIARDGKSPKSEINRNRREKTAIENAAMTGKTPPAPRAIGKSRAPRSVDASPRLPAPPPTTASLQSPLAAVMDTIRRR